MPLGRRVSDSRSRPNRYGLDTSKRCHGQMARLLAIASWTEARAPSHATATRSRAPPRWCGRYGMGLLPQRQRCPRYDDAYHRSATCRERRRPRVCPWVRELALHPSWRLEHSRELCALRDPFRRSLGLSITKPRFAVCPLSYCPTPRRRGAGSRRRPPRLVRARRLTGDCPPAAAPPRGAVRKVPAASSVCLGPSHAARASSRGRRDALRRERRQLIG